MLKIAVLVSGSGSNLQSILDSIDSGYIKSKIEMVISDNKDAYALKRAEIRGIQTFVFPKKDISESILNAIDGKVDLIVLAGFLTVLEGDILTKFKNRIINIHPSLIPSFCGNGMYGMNVHRAAIEYGVKVSGCTVHFVDEGTDTGPIILQRTVPVYSSDSPEDLQKRILNEEHRAMVDAIFHIEKGNVRVEGRKVVVEDGGAQID